MVWKEPYCHLSDCYFCLSKKDGFGKGMRWEYANVQSVVFPVLRSSECPNSVGNNIPSAADTTTETSETEFECEKQNKQLNDWVRDLDLSKEKAEILASRMRDRGFLEPHVRTTYFRSRDKQYSKYFEKKGNITFCSDILGLFQALKQKHTPEHWRLFIDSSKESLKAVLLHNGNEMPSVPIAHGINVKETYETMKLLLELIKYDQFKRKICCDLKVVAMLRGMQGGYTKYCCFLCLWDSRDTNQHYKQEKWPERAISVVGKKNIKNSSLVKKDNPLST